jgi:hypothetical protein
MNSKAWVAVGLALGLVACKPEAGGGGSGAAGASGYGGTAGSAGYSGTGGTAGYAGTGGTAGYSGVGGTAGTGPIVIGGGECKAGHYIGEFMGTYRSAAWGNGEDVNALMVASIDDPIAMTVGLEFWLEESGVECQPGEEFCGGYTINGGKMRGNANAFGLAVPFDIDLTGDLDCNTGEFRGQLSNGSYLVFGYAKYTFAGTIIADYDSANSSFVNGEWDVMEDAMPNQPWPPGANIGGEGTWSAHWADNSPAPGP